MGFVSNNMSRSGSIVRSTAHNPSCNSAYRRTVFEAAGGFREDLFPCEDLDLDRRLTSTGHRLGFAPAARVYHYRVRDLAEFRRMMCRYGAGHRQLVALHGRFSLLHWLPMALPAGCAGGRALAVVLYVSPVSGAALAAGGLAAILSLVAARGGPRHLPSNVHLLAEALMAWLHGYHSGKA